MVLAASITALFLRGFKFKDLGEQLRSKEIQTPAQDVWLIEVDNYSSKMDAYKAGIGAKDLGMGVYVIPNETKWSWVAGVYQAEDEAHAVLTQGTLPSDAKLRFYQIQSKKFAIDGKAVDTCQQVFATIQNVSQILTDLRTAVAQANVTKNLQIDLTTQYNRIKDDVEALQALNSDLQSDFVATVIYTANQNLMGLQDLIGTSSNVTMASVNNALLMTIFSLDNF